MDKILITGSNGFIGQELVNQILDKGGTELIALSRGKNRVNHAKDFIYIDADICDERCISAVIAKHKPDVVIHTVAMANVDLCEKNKAECDRVNISPLNHLTRLAEEHDFHLIYLSTDFIFDGLNGPYNEEDVPKPLNHYGASKLEAEKIILNSSCSWSIVRTILVYGVPYDENRSNLILWVKNSLENKQQINVVTDHFRMPTLVDDLVAACLTIASKRTNGIYHISSEEVFSIFEIAQEVADFWNLDKTLIRPVRSDELSASVARPSYTGFNIEKAKTQLGFSPSTLIEGLAKIDKTLFR